MRLTPFKLGKLAIARRIEPEELDILITRFKGRQRKDVTSGIFHGMNIIADRVLLQIQEINRELSLTRKKAVADLNTQSSGV